MHRRPAAIQVEGPRRRPHERELGHAAHGGGQRRVLEGQPHAAVGPVGGASAALPLIPFNSGLQVVGAGEVVQFALHRVQIFRIPEETHQNCTFQVQALYS